MDTTNLQNLAALTETYSSKPTRKRVTHACVYCSRSHASCDSDRPCKRCVDRGMGHLCKDHESVKKRGRKPHSMKSAPQNPQPTQISATFTPLPTSILPTVLPTQLPTGSPPSPISSPSAILTSSPSTGEGFLVDDSTLISYLLSSFSDGNYFAPEPPPPDDNNHQESANMAIDVIRRRLPEYADELVIGFINGREHVRKLMAERNVTVKVHCDEYLVFKHSEIQDIIKHSKECYENSTNPTLLFDRTGRVHYVNPAYKALTGFNFSLPSERFDFFHILSQPTLLMYIRSLVKLMNNFNEFKEVTGFILPGSVRLHSSLGEKYIDGTISITLKRDNLGVPLILIMNFLPSQLTEPQFFKFV